MNNQYFSLATEKKYPDRVKIISNTELFNIEKRDGDILPARLLGIEYHRWLKLCYQNFGSIIINNDDELPYPIFYRDIYLYKLLHILNLRAKYIVDSKELIECT